MDKSKKALFYMLVLMMTICDFVIFLTSMSVVFPRGSGWLTVICALEFILLVDIIPIFLLMPEIIALRRLSIENADSKEYRTNRSRALARASNIILAIIGNIILASFACKRFTLANNDFLTMFVLAALPLITTVVTCCVVFLVKIKKVPGMEPRSN